MERKSFLSTLKGLFSSRKWLTALGALVVSTGVIALGWDQEESAQAADRIINVVLVLSGLFIGSTAVEDAASKLSGK